MFSFLDEEDVEEESVAEAVDDEDSSARHEEVEKDKLAGVRLLCHRNCRGCKILGKYEGFGFVPVSLVIVHGNFLT